jgi:outer membrane protein OmpA-like peptidoglycan-associated protein
MSHDSRVPRLPKTWLGLLSGGICLVVGPGQPTALSVTTGGPFLERAVLIQDRPETLPDSARSPVPMETTPEGGAAGSFGELHEALAAARKRLEELSKAAEAVAAIGALREELVAVKEENQRLIAEIQTLRGGDQELENARHVAEARVVELSQALEEVTVRARQIDDELIAVRWQNAQLNTSLTQTRAARRETEAQAGQTQEALSARIEALEADGEQTAVEFARLREQLEDSERQLLAASAARAEAETQLAEMRDQLQQAERAGERLSAAGEQLRAAEEAAAAAQQELTRATQRVAALETERDEWRTQLASVSDQLEQTEAANDRLQSEAAELRQAAGTATDVARQNLVAVEQRIRELNEALGAIAPAAELSEIAPSGQASDEARASSPVAENPSAAAALDQRDSVAGAAASNADADLEVIKAASARGLSDERVSAALLSDLSLEQRLHVQGLLADLDGRIGEEGLKMIVPGGVLFALNGEEMQDSAHETLAKVAELINVYDDRKVHIVGHTDALGDAAYNKMLSERRAALVKQFFVDNFDVQEVRLSTEGLGEARPIASNATREGRRANRRVEVLILN